MRTDRARERSGYRRRLNLPWGEGQTPIGEILRLMQRNGWTFPASIELEHRIPEGSDAVRQVARCLEYCRSALA